MVEECVDRLRREVVNSLKHKWPEQRLTPEFRHDAYNFLFAGKGSLPSKEAGHYLRNKISQNVNFQQTRIVCMTSTRMG